MQLPNRINQIREELLAHPLYNTLQSAEDLKVFMESHVIAVWDFMSLLKALQIHLSCVRLPWIPKGDRHSRRLINQIVLEEESDLDFDGKPSSHFEMYVDAMHAFGASTDRINAFISYLRSGSSISESAVKSSFTSAEKDFVSFSLEIAEGGDLPSIAGAFTIGREDLIPDLFTSMVRGLNENSRELDLDRFIYYLERHIELDSGEHGPMAERMLSEICGDDPSKWARCHEAGARALTLRKGLWDDIYQKIRVYQQ